MTTAVPATQNQQTPAPVMIAGQGSGKPIYCAPGLADAVKSLETAKRQGNHWARVAIEELQALTSGHIGRKNVFVEESPHLRRNVIEFESKTNPYIKHSITLFYAFLPGLKATIAQQPDGSYFVTNLELDGRYSEAKENKQPGLYRVKKTGSEREWQVEYEKSGNIERNDFRAVAISDTKHDDPIKAANIAAECIVKVMGKSNVARFEAEGFDLHFTPGQRRLGGLIQNGAPKVESIHGSAVHLADTMLAAKNTVSVRWYSAYNGSAILTQAMKVLAARGVTLEGHEAFLYRPKTSPGDAIRLAHQLKFALTEDAAKTGLDPVGGISQWRVSGARLNNELDRYNNGSHNRMLVVGLGQGLAVAGALATAGVATGGSFPMVAAVAKALATATSGVSGALTLGAVAKHMAEPHVDKFKRLGKKG